MLKIIDDFLNKITMYRIALYSLIFIWAGALIFSWFNFLPYRPLDLILELIFILASCFFVNYVFARVFQAPTNIDSIYITSFILALIIAPADPLNNLGFLGWASALAMASKYILAWKKKHVFNPAALAVAITALVLGQSANWWIGTPVMAPLVAISGLLVVKKIRRFDLVISFFVASLTVIGLPAMFKSGDLLTSLRSVIFYSPLMFFAFIMLTEPMTAPPVRWSRLSYGALVGVLFSPAIHLGQLFSTPELALLAGNIFSFIVSPKKKLILKLISKEKLATDVYDFRFTDQKMRFLPGQYLEWTLDHGQKDNRGIRRFFTIASSPTEKEFRLGVKFYPQSSSFKRSLLAMSPGEEIVAGQLAGDFILPKDPAEKIIFIAGGIGVTPFRSMIKYLLDLQQRRRVILFYSNKTADEIVYQDIFQQAEEKLGIKTYYILTEAEKIPAGWRGLTGRLNEEAISARVPDYRECLFYLSGPRVMVDAFKETLKTMGVNRSRIKTDYFPGFA